MSAPNHCRKCGIPTFGQVCSRYPDCLSMQEIRSPNHFGRLREDLRAGDALQAEGRTEQIPAPLPAWIPDTPEMRGKVGELLDEVRYREAVHEAAGPKFYLGPEIVPESGSRGSDEALFRAYGGLTVIERELTRMSLHPEAAAVGAALAACRGTLTRRGYDYARIASDVQGAELQYLRREADRRGWVRHERERDRAVWRHESNSDDRIEQRIAGGSWHCRRGDGRAVLDTESGALLWLLRL